MGTLATVKFGLGIALIVLGALVAAFFGYMSTFGKNSSLSKKSEIEPEKSI